MAKRRIMGMPRFLLVGLLCLFVLLFVVGFLVGPLGRSMFGDLGLPAWLSLPHPEFKLPALPIALSVPGLRWSF